ncbi:uncharacterized protein V6R79_000782 [Siganus canaliculatus]
MKEAADELHQMLEEDELRGVALLVFANKQDLPRAMSVSDITEALGLSGVSQPELIFVVNSNDGERMKEVADELHQMLEEDELRGVALLVFANKQDLPRAMSVSDITEALGLSGVSQPGLIFVVDSNNGERMKEAADELHQMLEEDELRGVALLVFANKQDMPRAMSISDITEALGLSGVSQPELIFVVDSNDGERMKEAADELHQMLEEDELRGVALLVFANKQDLPRAMSVSDITEALGLSGVSQPWLVQPSCAVSGSGLVEGLDWLSNQILKK